MPLILAIEPDPKQAATLKRLVRERVRADLVLADSKDAALAAFRTQVPDLILVTALLSPRDEVELTDHLRSLDRADHLQTLTIPLLAAAAPEPRPAGKKGLLGAFTRKSAKKTGTDGCDPAVFAAEIRGYLERAHEMQSEQQARETAPAEEMAATPTAEAAGTDTPLAVTLVEALVREEPPAIETGAQVDAEPPVALAPVEPAASGVDLIASNGETTFETFEVRERAEESAPEPHENPATAATEPEWLAAIIEDLRRATGGSTPTVELVSETETPQLAFEPGPAEAGHHAEAEAGHHAEAEAGHHAEAEAGRDNDAPETSVPELAWPVTITQAPEEPAPPAMEIAAGIEPESAIAIGQEPGDRASEPAPDSIELWATLPNWHESEPKIAACVSLEVGRRTLEGDVHGSTGSARAEPETLAASAEADPVIAAAPAAAVQAPAEMPLPRDTEWITSAIEALRRDIERLRTERTAIRQPAAQSRADRVATPPPPAGAPPRAPRWQEPVVTAAAAREPDAQEMPARKSSAKRTGKRRTRPLVDEWGLYDPDRCGIEALIARVEQDREEEPIEDEDLFEAGAAVPAFARSSAEAAIDPDPSEATLSRVRVNAGAPAPEMPAGHLESAGEPADTRLPPLTRWARLEWEPIDLPVAARDPDEVRGLLRGLAIPSEIANVQYASGCRIRRVRVAARQRARRASGAREPVLILSRKRLRELQAGAPKEESSSVMMRA